MCKGEGCPLSTSCSRYILKPKLLKPYFTESPYENGDCVYYKNKNENIKET